MVPMIMLEYLAIIFIFSSVFLYAVLLMIECGATVFAAVPELLDTGKKTVSSYIVPLWETTNVFLVFAFVSLMAFFPGAISAWGHALVVPFFVFLAVMGVRAIGMLFVFYHDGTGRFARNLLVCAALASPAVFAAGIIPYFLTGGAFPSGIAGSLLALYLGGLALATTFFLSFSFFEYRAARRGAHMAPSFDFLTSFFPLSFILLSLLFFLVLPVVVPHIAVNFNANAAVPFFFGLSVLELVSLMPPYRNYKGRRFVLSVALFAVVFFGIAFAQLPYVVYPAITIFNAFTDAATARAMFLVLGSGAIITVPALCVLYYLFAYKDR